MKVKFWLLDVNYEVRDSVPEIWLWGIKDSGERILVIDRNFFAYFYVVVESGFDPEKVVREIEKGHYPSIVKSEVVERKFFGEPVKAVKVYCQNPDLILKYAKTFRKFEGVKECLEDDIRYSMRYLIDNNVVPCGWHEIEVAEEKSKINVQVNRIYTAKTFPKFVEETATPQLKI